MVRQEFVLQGMTGVTAYDGKTRLEDRALAGQEGRRAAGRGGAEGRSSRTPTSTVRWSTTRQKGNKVEFVGTEPVEGTDAYKLKVTLASGDVRYYYMDTDYFVPDQDREEAHDPRRRARVRDIDRRLQGGRRRVLPLSFESGTKGSPNRTKVVYDKIEANVPLDDSRFAPAGSDGTSAPGRPRAEERASTRSTHDARDAALLLGLAARRLADSSALPSRSTPKPSPASARATSARRR